MLLIQDVYLSFQALIEIFSIKKENSIQLKIQGKGDT